MFHDFKRLHCNRFFDCQSLPQLRNKQYISSTSHDRQHHHMLKRFEIYLVSINVVLDHPTHIETSPVQNPPGILMLCTVFTWSVVMRCKKELTSSPALLPGVVFSLPSGWLDELLSPPETVGWMTSSPSWTQVQASLSPSLREAPPSFKVNSWEETFCHYWINLEDTLTWLHSKIKVIFCVQLKKESHLKW